MKQWGKEMEEERKMETKERIRTKKGEERTGRKERKTNERRISKIKGEWKPFVILLFSIRLSWWNNEILRKISLGFNVPSIFLQEGNHRKWMLKLSTLFFSRSLLAIYILKYQVLLGNLYLLCQALTIGRLYKRKLAKLLMQCVNKWKGFDKRVNRASQFQLKRTANPRIWIKRVNIRIVLTAKTTNKNERLTGNSKKNRGENLDAISEAADSRRWRHGWRRLQKRLIWRIK